MAQTYKDFLAEQEKKPDFCPFDNPKTEDVILQNDTAYLTYALAPYAQDHLLVIPKRHVLRILELNARERDDIDTLLNMAWNMLQKLGHRSVSYLVREGTESGRTVSHIHYHAIPDIRMGDLDHNGDAREILSPEDVEQTLIRLRTALGVGEVVPAPKA